MSLLQQVLAARKVAALLVAVGGRGDAQCWSFAAGCAGPKSITVEQLHTTLLSQPGRTLLFLDGFEDTALSLAGLLVPVPWARAIVCTRSYTGFVEGATNAVRCMTLPMSVHRATHLMMMALRSATMPEGAAAVSVSSNINGLARFLAEQAHCNPRAILRLAGNIRCLAAAAPVQEEQIREWLASNKVLLSACGMLEEYRAPFEALPAADREMLTLLGWMCPSILALEWVQAVERALELELLPLLFRLLQTLWVHIDETGASFRLDPFLRSYILAFTEKPSCEVGAKVVGLTMERVEDVIQSSVVSGSTVAAEMDPRQWDVANVASALLRKEKEASSKDSFLNIVCHGYKVLQLFLPPADRLRLYERALAILEQAEHPPGSKHYRFRAVAKNAHGIALLQLGKFGEALAEFRQSLVLFEALSELQEGHMESAMVRHNVGYALAKNGRELEGLEQLRLAEQQKLALQEVHGLGSASGKVHPMLSSTVTFNASLASTHDSIGEVYFLLGVDADALDHFDRAIALRKGNCEGLCCCSASQNSSCSSNGVPDPNEPPPPGGARVCQCSRTTNLGLATSYLHKAKLMFKQAKFEVAGRLLKRAIGIRQRVLGPSNYLAAEAKQLGEELLQEFQRAHQEVDPSDTLTCCSPTQEGEAAPCDASSVAAAAAAAVQPDTPTDDAIFNVGSWLEGVTSNPLQPQASGGHGGSVSTPSSSWSAEQQLAFLMGPTQPHGAPRPEDVLDLDWLLM